MWSLLSSIGLLVAGISGAAAQFNNPEGVDIWCGKAYRAKDASFNPGGWFEEPPYSADPLLRLLAKPRMTIYLASDGKASLLVDAGISHQLGEPIDSKYAGTSTKSKRSAAAQAKVVIKSGNSVLATTTIAVGSVDNEVAFPLHALAARTEAYTLTVTAKLGNGVTYTTSTQLYHLPKPTDSRTVSRIDNLYGGLWYQRSTETTWQPFFPYTYYVQWTLYWNSNVSTLDEFAAIGYNLIHIVPTGSLGESPFPWAEFQPYLDRAAELGIFFQYDVIWTATNDSSMIEQVTALQSHPSILLWYQSDEPDGKSVPINSTGLARQTMWDLDPYHPSSLALNCDDFYYADYAQGGEVIISDVYPISANTSWSTVYETPCNATYGCCGCDDCHGAFEDISERIDENTRRDGLLGWQKTQWAAPQAFGNETFWTRYPTAAEEVVMALLAVNHGAKGLVAWDFPTTGELSGITEKLAAVMTSSKIASFLLEQPLTQTLTVTGGSRVDASIWINKSTKEALLTVINLNYGNISAAVKVALPSGVQTTAVKNVLWGDVSWTLGSKGGVLSSSSGLLGLQVSMVVLKLR